MPVMFVSSDLRDRQERRRALPGVLRIVTRVTKCNVRRGSRQLFSGAAQARRLLLSRERLGLILEAVLHGKYSDVMRKTRFPHVGPSSCLNSV